MTFTFTYAKESSGYLRYEHGGRSVYLPKSLVAAEPPATITVSGDGLAEAKSAKVQDPALLEARATKAARARPACSGGGSKARRGG